MQKLESVGATKESIDSVSELFSEESPYCNPFKGLDTHYKQLSFYKKSLNLLVQIQ